MQATRARFGSALEWVLAAAIIAVVFLTGSIIWRELKTVSATMPIIARESQPSPIVPAGVPARAVSVPVLLLQGEKQVRVGDTVSTVAARLGREAEVGSQIVERARYGERLTRFYEHQGTRFVLVFEPFEPHGEPKVAAIYLQ